MVFKVSFTILDDSLLTLFIDTLFLFLLLMN